jgi:hypothetical protein
MKGKKTGGRTAGTPNRISSELRKMLKVIIAGELETLPSALEQLPAKERLELLIKLLPFCVAKVEPINGTYDSGWNLDDE